MVVFKYIFMSASSLLSASDSRGVGICRGPLPRRSPLDEAPATAGCGGMGWATSMPSMQLQ
jgi:hypothetical protein